MKRERRAHKRHPILIGVVLETPDRRELAMRLRDLSVSGAFLEKTDPSTPLPSTGSEVGFTIRYQSEHGAEIERARARVVRVRPDGIAIEFLRTAVQVEVA